MQNGSIRPARADEAEVLSHLAQRSKAVWGYSAEFMAACRSELSYSATEIRSAHFRVAEIDGRIVGFHALNNQVGDTMELDALFIDPEWIGRGCGHWLLDDARIYASLLGAARLMIQSDPYAEAFYLARGAQRIGYLESHSIPGRQLPLLCLNLSEDEN